MSDGTSNLARRARPGASGAGDAPGESAEANAIDALRRALRDIEYGSVLIKIHQGEVVGIETSTKVRLKGSQRNPRDRLDDSGVA